MEGAQNAVLARMRAEGGDDGLTFRRFMELALYDPAHGFYSGPSAEIGRAGHFLTSASMSRLFGQILAQQINEIWNLLGRPKTFRLIEAGAHDGRLGTDVLGWCRDFAPELYASATYTIVEPFAYWQTRQRAAFRDKGMEARLGHAASFDELSMAPAPGVVLCNELLDAFPVPIVRFSDGEWREMRVLVGGDACHWRDGPLTTAGLRDMVGRLPLPRIEGYRTEIHDALCAWLNAAAAALSVGATIIVDYGMPEDVYYSSARTEGTIRAYHRHRMSADVLASPGKQDLTAHVNWTELIRASRAAGLDHMGTVDQHRFAVGALEEDLRRLEGKSDLAGFAAAFRAIAHPEGMGGKFEVVGFSKGLGTRCRLSGFRYARAETPVDS